MLGARARRPGSRSGGSPRYDGDAFFHMGRVQKLLALHASRCARWTSSATAASIRATPSRSGTSPWRDLEARRRRPARRLPAPADGAAPALVRADLRGRDGALRLALGRCRDGRWRSSRLLGLASGTGGGYTSLALPATASRTLLLPTLLALVFVYVREPSWPRAGVGRGRLDRDDARPPELLGARRVGLVGFLLVRALLDRRHDVGTSARRWRRSSSPPAWSSSGCSRSSARPLAQPVRKRAEPRVCLVSEASSSPRPPQLPARARALRPGRRDRGRRARCCCRWPSSRTGGCGPRSCSARCWRPSPSRCCPFVFPHFADAVSISQARRMIGFSPRAFVARRRARSCWRASCAGAAPVALAAGDRAAARLPRRLRLALTASSTAPPGAADLDRLRRRRSRSARRRALRRRIPQVQGAPLVAAAGVALFLHPGRRARVLALDGGAEVAHGAPAAASSRAARARCRDGAVVFSDPDRATSSPASRRSTSTRRRRRTSPTRARTGRPRGARRARASSATAARSRCRAATARTGCWSTARRVEQASRSACRVVVLGIAVRSLPDADESPARHAVLPAGGRRRRAAAAEARRRTCPRSGSRRTCSRPTTRSGCTATTSCAADAGLGAPRALPRPARRGARRRSCTARDGPRPRAARRRGCSAGACSSPTRT